MPTDLLPGTTNVVRFPVEARPTLDLLREIAPDVRQVLNLADAFGMEPPSHGLRDSTDAETASHVALHVPATGPRRAAMLRDVEEPVIRRAVDACRAVQAAGRAAKAARATLLAAEASQASYDLDGLRQDADAAEEHAVVLLLQAHARAEEAHGVARAVGCARRGETWTPCDADADTDALIALGTAVA